MGGKRKPDQPGPATGLETIRLDKWLWAARFYKTRALAADAVAGGKVEVNGDRVKRSRAIRPGDRIRLRLGPYEYRLGVTGLSERRLGPALAAGLYREEPEAKARRELLAEQHRTARAASGSRHVEGRPSKKDRRDLKRLKRGPERD